VHSTVAAISTSTVYIDGLWATREAVSVEAMNRSMLPEALCECGELLEPCVGCAEPRCTGCDPYLTDDCGVGTRLVA
jgi:hypothetical protein